MIEMDKNLFGEESYSIDELQEMEPYEVSKRGYCPSCIEDGLKLELISEAGCERCPRCGWSLCKVG